jgi:hypothetical protein
MVRTILIYIAAGLSTASLSAQEAGSNAVVSTFSIVARDSITGEIGVAVASRFFAVGSVVPWARADVGAVATQSFANTSLGWRGLELLERGATPEDAMKILLRNDTEPDRRPSWHCGFRWKVSHLHRQELCAMGRWEKRTELRCSRKHPSG